MENDLKTLHVITHDGTFHADETFAVGMVFLMIGGSAQVKLHRTRNIEPLISKIIELGDEAIVIDVGGRYMPKNPITNITFFDHHQKGMKERYEESQVPMASAGLVWREFGYSIITNLLVNKHRIDLDLPELLDIHDMVIDELIEGIDAVDNGVGVGNFTPLYKQMTISKYIAMLNALPVLPELNSPVSRSMTYGETENDKRFASVVINFVIPFLNSVISHLADVVAGVKILKAANTHLDGSVVYTDHSVNKAMSYLAKNTNADFWAFKHKDSGHIYIQSVPASTNEAYTNKIPFPPSWRGLNDDELQKVSGIPTAVFCHKNGHLFAAKTLEDCLTAAKVTKELHLK